jgi:hypothetical protein
MKVCSWLLPAATAAVLLVASANGLFGSDEDAARGAVRFRIESREDKDGEPHVRLFLDGEAVDVRQAEQPAEEEQSAFLGVGIEPAKGGVRVTQVFPGGPADRAGLRVGDVITAVDDQRVRTRDNLLDAVRSRQPGQRVTVAYRRGDETRAASVELGEAPGMFVLGIASSSETAPPEGSSQPFLGIVASSLSDDMKEIAGTDEGVLINELIDGSPAFEGGLLPGDVIVQVDSESVAAPERFVEIIRSREPGDEVLLTYYRMGRKRRTSVTLGERPSEAREEGLPLWELPEGLRQQMPELREYLERLRPEMEDWAERFHDWQQRQRRRLDEEERPAEPSEPHSYRFGKDIGRILEKLDRLERRIDELEERTERRLREMEERLEHRR